MRVMVASKYFFQISVHLNTENYLAPVNPSISYHAGLGHDSTIVEERFKYASLECLEKL